MTTSSKWRSKVIACICAVVLCIGMACALVGCGGGQNTSQSGTREFIDSVGRTVEIPANIERIAPSGHTAQQVLLTIAPDKMVGLSTELTADQIKYLNLSDTMNDKPVFGAIFGAKGDLNKEAIAAADPQVIIDTGEAKDGIKEDLDNLQEQLGIPCVFIETKLDDYASGYQMLGELLGMEERGKELSDYCKNAYDTTKKVMDSIPEADRVNMAYLLGDAGLNAIAKNSYQGQVIDMCANNVVVVEKASGSGQGQEISLEQLAVWNPELIVFAPAAAGGGHSSGEGMYATVSGNPAWADIAAVKNDNYYQVPIIPWNWLNNPPTVNQVMGMQWLPRLLYPDKFDDSIADVTKSYFKTFYGYDLSDAEVAELIKDATPRK